MFKLRKERGTYRAYPLLLAPPVQAGICTRVFQPKMLAFTGGTNKRGYGIVHCI